MNKQRDGGVSPVIATLLIVSLIAVLTAIIVPITLTTAADFAVQEKKVAGVTVRSLDASDFDPDSTKGTIGPGEKDGYKVTMKNGKDFDTLESYQVICRLSDGTTVPLQAVGKTYPAYCPKDTAYIDVVGNFADGISEVIFSGRISDDHILMPTVRTVTVQ